MSDSVGNSSLLLIVMLIVIGLLLLIAFSFLEAKIRGLKNVENDSNLNALVNDFYSIRAVNLAILMVVGLFFLEFFHMFRDIVSLGNTLSILITVVAGSLILIVFGVIPIVRISENRYESVLVKTSKFIKLIKYIFIPFTFLYTIVVDKFYKPRKKTMTEDELLVMVDRAEQEFGINQNESKLIKSVLDFDELKVLDIYTPRVDLVAISIKSTNEDITKIFNKSGFSRLPVYEESIDNILGIINHKDFYNKVLLEEFSLKTIISKPLEVTEYMDVTNLLALLKKNQEHLAVVKDEYGGTLGVVTMEDILEELVGDIWDEHDNIIESIKKIEDDKFLVHGNTYLTDLVEKFGLDELEEEDYITVNGWITANLGKIGSVGDSFIYKNLVVKVITASQKKVFEVMINKIDKDNSKD